jgi:hypothetical protein
VGADLVSQELAERQAWLRAQMAFPRGSFDGGKTQRRAAQESGDIDVVTGPRAGPQ